MAKWNYLTYNRTCHDSFLVHHAKSAVQSEATSEATSEAIQKSNAVAEVVHLQQVLPNLQIMQDQVVLH